MPQTPTPPESGAQRPLPEDLQRNFTTVIPPEYASLYGPPLNEGPIGLSDLADKTGSAEAAGAPVETPLSAEVPQPELQAEASQPSLKSQSWEAFKRGYQRGRQLGDKAIEIGADVARHPEVRRFAGAVVLETLTVQGVTSRGKNGKLTFNDQNLMHTADLLGSKNGKQVGKDLLRAAKKPAIRQAARSAVNIAQRAATKK